MADVYWVNLNWRSLRFLVGQFEKEYEAKGLSKDEVVQLDSSTSAYISSLLTFFERKIQKLQIYVLTTPHLLLNQQLTSFTGILI